MGIRDLIPHILRRKKLSPFWHTKLAMLILRRFHLETDVIKAPVSFRYYLKINLSNLIRIIIWSPKNINRRCCKFWFRMVVHIFHIDFTFKLSKKQKCEVFDTAAKNNFVTDAEPWWGIASLIIWQPDNLFGCNKSSSQKLWRSKILPCKS